MKNVLIFIALLFLTGCATTYSAIKNNTSFSKYRKVYVLTSKEDPRQVLPRVRERLEQLGFEVVMTDEDGPVGGNQGTGFIISPDGYLFTSAHVLGKQTVATVWLNDKRYEADLVYIEKDQSEDDKTKRAEKSLRVQTVLDASLNSKKNRSITEELDEKDMALLKIRSPDQTFIPVSFARDPQYRMGQDVYTIGFPLSTILGDKPRLNKGLISSTVGIKDNPSFVQMSAEIQPGNSGGPLLNDKGQVVGMVQMTLNPMQVLSQTGNTPQNVNFAVKNAPIRDFLHNSQKAMSLPVREGAAVSFDDVQNSIVQVHSGIVPEDFKKASKLVCSVSYVYLWDMWYRFQVLDVRFHDLDTQELLLRAGQYGDDPFSTENITLDRVFKEIKVKMGK